MEKKIIKTLLIEDNPDDAELMKRRLGKSADVNFAVTAVRTLNEGLSKLEQMAPDLIISDLGLPDSHGLDTVNKILTSARQIPLVVLSGFNDEATAIKAVQAGAQDYLVKGQLEGVYVERSLSYAIERAHMQRKLEEHSQEILNIQANLTKILEKNADALIVVDEEKTILFSNPAVETLLGRSQKDLINKPFEYTLGEAGSSAEIEIKRPDKVKTIAEMRVEQITWECKPAYLASLRNITRRKQIEEALRESEKTLRMYLENAPDGVYISDLKGKFHYGNRKAEEIIGYSREEMLGKNFLGLKLLPAAYSTKAVSLLAKNAIGRPTGPDEFQLNKRDNTQIWVEINTTPFHQEGETRILGFVRDITERKKTESALQESEEKFYKAFQSSPQVIVISRLSDGIIVDVNDTFLRLTGFTLGEIIGRKSPETGIWANPEDRAAMVDELKKTGLVRDKEYRFHMKSGDERIWLFSAEMVNIKDEPCIISVTTDITERKAMEEKLRHLDEMKSEFLSNVAHELRTPLQSIGGFTKLIMAGQVPDAATQQEFLQIIDDETTHLGNLINSLLDLSRLESGRFQINKRLTPVKEAIAEPIKSFLSLARDKNITLSQEIPTQLPVIEIDGDRLRQVVINLLGNAIKFSDPGGSVKIKAEEKNGELVVQVSDHGIGISDDAMKHLFERFYRAEGEVVRGGTGLGLYVSRQIIDAHGGRIWAESKLGEGSTFSFTLPLNGKGGK